MPRFRLKRESGNFHEWSDDEDQHGDGTGTVASKVSSLIHQAPPAHVALSGLASVKRFAFTLGLGGTRRTGRVHCGNVCIQADKAYVPKEKHPVLESHKDNQDDSGKGSQDCQSKQFMRSPTLAHYFSRLGTVTLRRENQGSALPPRSLQLRPHVTQGCKVGDFLLVDRNIFTVSPSI
uniref:Uncharacterized protein n=1 Tax=Dunaliella tertiolecta TaxID=3047 RepID=A0A7S3QW60_DUNTE